MPARGKQALLFHQLFVAPLALVLIAATARRLIQPALYAV